MDTIHDEIVHDTIVQPKKVHLLDLNFATYLPQSAYNRHQKTPHWGFNFGWQYQIQKEGPLFIGGNLGFNFINSKSGKVDRQFDNLVEEWDATTTTYMMSLALKCKYYFEWQFWNFESYATFSTGYQYFWANTNFEFPDSDESDSDFEDGDGSIYYGGSLGLTRHLDQNIFLDFSVGYRSGLSMHHFVLDQKDIEPEFSTIEHFSHKKSTLDLLAIKLGVTFAF